jgi:hypothetical protein
LIPHPPPMQDIGLRREVRLRFLCNSAFESAITFQNLLDILNVAATTVTAYDLFYSVKIKFVELWANGLANASATVTIIYDGSTAGSVGDQKLHTDSSMGIEPAHVRATPAPRTLASMYQLSSSAVAFFLNVPAGAVVDVGLSFRNPIAGNQVPVQNAPVATVAGVVYMRGLDGVAAAGSKFTPVGALATD